jgi:NAD(P)H-dependent FMN reductase
MCRQVCYFALVITVIISTNRKESTTARVALLMQSLIQKQGEDVQVLDLANLPADFFRPTMYDQRSPEFTALFERYIVAARHLLFVIPEYNGSYPGVLKLFIDASPVKSFWNKHASMIGLSDGHAGNMRGQDHLTGVLHYLKMHVHYHKPKLSGITKSFDNEGNLINERYMTQLEEHASLISHTH